ncbi:semaphorin-3E isoform X1 [Rhinichthys klamathensis goyatoka]|uniref:semaphorin-3E isoform X1 n=1 Tax=Rhinichthys klamathensis goyatoka TaxID=3034132 RepID=UPI0024B4F521|nr:semaphorin-3E isoform X1 [Rhinichthys klamathensis goyatoka]
MAWGVWTFMLCMTLWISSATQSAKSVYPRLRLSHKDLWELNRTWLFQAGEGRLLHYSMLLDETQERLIVGGKDILYSLNLERITAPHKEIHWASSEEQVGDCLMQGREKPECANYIKLVQHYNSTHLLACGTGAFSPVCAYIRVGQGTQQEQEFRLESDHIESGKGRCPFHPNSPSASTVYRGELFVGLYTDYWENDAALYRLGNHSFIRTEVGDRQQLNEPKFVGSAVIPDNDDPADDKVYYFFTERVANMEGGNKAVYTRVGRVCANDQGGQRMLVNRWSSFLKTRLICSVAGPNGIDTHFDELEDVFVLRKKDEKNPEIFGLFSTTSAVFKGYAVCMYNMEDIRAVFNGPFAHRERSDHHWKVYDGSVPYPRPGSCASKINGGQFSSSKAYPDEVLRFARSHPLMFQAVQPVHRRPILLDTEGGRKLTQLAVDRVEAEDGHYNVLFIGTDNSVVLKMITIYNKEAGTVEEVLLEELQVFKVPVPITEILVSTKRQQLYVGSELGVTQIRVHQCGLYGSACADCCLARDPYCAWDGFTCSRYYPAGLYTKRRFRRQDVRHGNAVQQCNGLQLSEEQSISEKLVYGVENNSTLLECRPRSLQASVMWYIQHGVDMEEVKGDDRVIHTPHGLLLLKIAKGDAGVYVCQSTEHGFVQMVVRVTLEVLDESKVEGLLHKGEEEEEGDSLHRPPPCPFPNLPSASSKHWYKDFMQLIGYSNFQRVEQYCEKVWCVSDRKRKKLKGMAPKWRYTPGAEQRARARAPRHTQ